MRERQWRLKFGFGKQVFGGKDLCDRGDFRY